MKKLAFVFAIATSFVSHMALACDEETASAKKLVVTAMDELFVKKDVSALDRYWSKNYIQHSPEVGSGTEGLRSFDLSKITFEMGMVIAEGDRVAVHGRYTGFTPTPMIAVDIFRVENGKLAEHWDVLQEEVQKTKSGNPMFTPRKMQECVGSHKED